MSEVKRHSVTGYGRQDINYNDPEGEFVYYEDYAALQQKLDAAEVKLKRTQAALAQAEWVISGEQQNVRTLQGRESALNDEILTLKAIAPVNQQEPAAWLVGGWAYHDRRSAERRSVYDNLLMEPLFTHPALSIDLNSVRAEGVEILTSRLQQLIDEGVFGAKEIGVAAGAVHEGAQIAANLRSGTHDTADKAG